MLVVVLQNWYNLTSRNKVISLQVKMTASTIHFNLYYSLASKIELIKNTITTVCGGYLPVSDSEVSFLTGNLESILLDVDDTELSLLDESKLSVAFIARNKEGHYFLPLDKAKVALQKYPRFIFLNSPKLLEIYDR